MPVMQLVMFFMHINLKRTSKWIAKFLCFFFERDTKGKNPPVLLCSTPSNRSSWSILQLIYTNQYPSSKYVSEAHEAVYRPYSKD